jgi:hypothetical protein
MAAWCSGVPLGGDMRSLKQGLQALTLSGAVANRSVKPRITEIAQDRGKLWTWFQTSFLQVMPCDGWTNVPPMSEVFLA